MQDYHYKSLHNQEQISIENGILRLKKSSKTYKDFGKLFYKDWLENFLNYISIIVSLFTPSITELNVAPNFFYSNIFQLSQVYKWQEAIFSLAIEVHI